MFAPPSLLAQDSRHRYRQMCDGKEPKSITHRIETKHLESVVLQEKIFNYVLIC